MAIGLAICHGLMMTPIQVLKEKHPTNDKWKGMCLLYAIYRWFDFKLAFLRCAMRFLSCRALLFSIQYSIIISRSTRQCLSSRRSISSSIAWSARLGLMSRGSWSFLQPCMASCGPSVVSLSLYWLVDWVFRQEWHSGSAPPTSCPRSWPIQSPPDCLRSSLPSSMSSSTRLLGYGSNLL